MMTVSGVRRAMINLARLWLSPKLAFPTLAYMSWLILVISCAYRIGIWTWDLAASTLLWLLLVGLSWLVSINGAAKDREFFHRKMVEALSIGAMLEFFVNLAPLNLPAEILLQTTVGFVALMHSYTAGDATSKQLHGVVTVALGAFGWAMLCYTGYQVISSWPTLRWHDVVDQLLMPVWLTAAAILALYPLAVAAGYESLFTQMQFMNDRKPTSWRAKIGVLIELRGSVQQISRFCEPHATEAAQATTIKAARYAVANFKRDCLAKKKVEAAVRARLERFAGVPGVDSSGLLLDRREFGKTKEALRWMATRQTWAYERNGKQHRYSEDALDQDDDLRLGDSQGGHAIVVRVSKSGQQWLAYRTTPSGYTFGIGAIAPPPDQWLFDGQDPPRGFPSKEGRWTHSKHGEPIEWFDE